MYSNKDATLANADSLCYYTNKKGRVAILTYDTSFLWEAGIKNLLEAEKAWNIVQGTELPPARPAPASTAGPSTCAASAAIDEVALAEYQRKLDDYEERRCNAKALIFASVHSSLQQLIAPLSDPKEMFDKLKSEVDTLEACSGAERLRSEFYNTRMEPHQHFLYVRFLCFVSFWDF